MSRPTASSPAEGAAPTVAPAGPTPGHGRGWAYAGLIGGAAGSIAANVGHAFLPPPGWHPATTHARWRPEPGAIAWGVAVAVALLISVEVLARIDWPTTWGWRAVQYAGGSTVALVAAGTSYHHLADLLKVWHETTPVIYGGPAIVDGLMILCSFALMVPTPSSPPINGPTTVPAPDRIETHPSAPPAVDPVQPVTANPPSALATEPDRSTPTDRIGPDRIAIQTEPAGSSTGSNIGPGGPPASPDPMRSERLADRPASHRSDRPGRSTRPGRGDPSAALVQVRAEDLRRVARAVEVGELPATPTATAIRTLLGISPAYARATRDALTAQDHPVATVDAGQHLPQPKPMPQQAAAPATEKPDQTVNPESSASTSREAETSYEPLTTRSH